MPRPLHAQGRPGTAVIPADWNQTHAPVAEKTMRGHVQLSTGATEQTWDEELEQMVTTPVPPYYGATTDDRDGACRVQALRGQTRQVVSADDDETVADYLITVPLTVDAREGHLGVVTATGDTALDGRTVRIEQVVRGTERFERDLFVTLVD